MLEIVRVIRSHPPGQHLFLPGRRGKFQSLELRDHLGEPGPAVKLGSGLKVLPPKKKPHEAGWGHRLDLPAQPAQGQPVDPGQQPAVAPLHLSGRAAGREPPLQDHARVLESRERAVNDPKGQPEARGQAGRGNRPETLHPALHYAPRGILLADALFDAARHRNRGRHLRVRPQRPQPGKALDGDIRGDLATFQGPRGHRRPAVRHEGRGHARPLRGIAHRQHAQREQKIVELVGGAEIGPRLRPHLGQRLGIERAERPRQFGVGAPQRDRARPPLLQRGVVQERVGIGVQDLVRHRRGRRRLHRDRPDLAAVDRIEHIPQAVHVHGLPQAVLNGLGHQRMIRHRDRARVVVPAGHLFRKHRGQQVFRPHPDQRNRHPAASLLPQHRERARDVPPPAVAEHRDGQQRLHEIGLERRLPHHAEHVLERERMLLPEGQDEPVVGRGRLQLEIEGEAEALAERQSPGPRDPPPKGGMEHELHPAALIEKPLRDHRPLGRHHPERRLGGRDVGGGLPGPALVQAGLLREPPDGGLRIRPGGREPLRYLRAQFRDGLRELAGAGRGLAQPEGRAGREPVRVLDEDPARADVPDPPRHVAEQKDVVPLALDGKVLVEPADEGPGGFLDDIVIARVGDGAPRRDRGEARPPPGPQPPMHAVPVQEGAAAAPPVRDALAQDLQHPIELVAAQIPVGPGPPHQVPQVLLSHLGGRHRGDHLLRHHVQRLDRLPGPVEVSGPDGPHRRGALEQVVPRQRKEDALGRRSPPVSGASDPLEQRRERAGRADVADQVHVADIDPEFQRGGRHHDRHLAGLEPLLGGEADRPAEAAVVRGHAALAEPRGERVRDALHLAPGVDEHKRRAVPADVRGNAVVDFFPQPVGRDRPELLVHHFDAQVQRPPVPDVHDAARRCAAGLRTRPDQQARDLLDRLLGGAQADALQAPPAERVQPLEGERQVRAPLVPGDRVDLVHDHGRGGGEQAAAALGGEQDVERLGGGDQDVRRTAHHPRAVAGRCVARPHHRADLRQRTAGSGGKTANPFQRLMEVLLDVVAERLERRHVHHIGAVRQPARLRLQHEAVQRPQERGERFPGPGRRRDHDIAPGGDLPPSGRLRRGRGPEPLHEPPPHERMKPRQRVRAPFVFSFLYKDAHDASLRRPPEGAPVEGVIGSACPGPRISRPYPGDATTSPSANTVRPRTSTRSTDPVIRHPRYGV